MQESIGEDFGGSIAMLGLRARSEYGNKLVSKGGSNDGISDGRADKPLQ